MKLGWAVTNYPCQHSWSSITIDILLCIFCQHITRKLGDDIQLEGANASAEEADEGTEEAMESGVDLILNHRLVETGFGKKADYMTYLKDYMKKVVKYLEDNNKGDQVDSFKKNINGVMKSLLGKFNDLQFFTGIMVFLSEFLFGWGLRLE